MDHREERKSSKGNRVMVETGCMRKKGRDDSSMQLRAGYTIHMEDRKKGIDMGEEREKS